MLNKNLKVRNIVRFPNTDSPFMDMIVVETHPEVVLHRPFIIMEDNKPVLKHEVLSHFSPNMEWELVYA
jgi:hypothetical protein